MAKRIFIVRHGETDWNVSGKLTSYSDVPLNKNGQYQAQEAAENLEGIDFQEIRVSPLLRAKQTAETIQSANLASTDSLTVDERLTELDFGEFEGLTKSELRSKKLLTIYEGWSRGRNSAKEAESLDAATNRAMELFNDIVDSPAETLLLVSHGHFARIFLICCILKGEAGNHRAFRMDNGKFAQINIGENDVRLVSFNSVKPLP